MAKVWYFSPAIAAHFGPLNPLRSYSRTSSTWRHQTPTHVPLQRLAATAASFLLSRIRRKEFAWTQRSAVNIIASLLLIQAIPLERSPL